MRALVVGAGRMGGFHRRVLRDLGLDVTTVDPSPRAGADYLTVPSRRFDVVCVAAPIEHLADEAARWVGHEGWLLVEKPFAATLTDARPLADDLVGQHVAVGYVERFNPQVREFRRRIEVRGLPRLACFTRLNRRPSPSIDLDLKSHDVDLARVLGLECPVKYVYADDVDVTARVARAGYGLGDWVTVDLMAHDTSPVHAQWHAFLSGRPGYATPIDAVHVLAELERQRLPVAA